MVKLIVGGKGSGKSRRLVNDLNTQAENPENNIICILRGDRLDQYVKYRVRMIDIDQYPVSNFDELLSFIAGLNARDYDITHIYIDSITKVVRTDDQEALARFLAALEGMSEDKHFDAEITYSCEPGDLSESVRKFS
ncbi:MAG: hypothetical protein GX588_05570 [Clostridiaceae bacterium]|nr:hypothetical protein [Clostridiaceae bacterium]